MKLEQYVPRGVLIFLMSLIQTGYAFGRAVMAFCLQIRPEKIQTLELLSASRYTRVSTPSKKVKLMSTDEFEERVRAKLAPFGIEFSLKFNGDSWDCVFGGNTPCSLSTEFIGKADDHILNAVMTMGLLTASQT